MYGDDILSHPTWSVSHTEGVSGSLRWHLSMILNYMINRSSVKKNSTLKQQPEHLAEPEWYFHPAPYICVNAITVELERCGGLLWATSKQEMDAPKAGTSVSQTIAMSLPYSGKAR